MSDFGRLLNAGIDVDGPGGLIQFNQQVKFNQGAVPIVGRGKMFYVDSVNGSDNYNGKTPTQAKATVNGAMDLVTASQGDTIYLLPGHAETISTATGFVMDVAGVSVIGIGTGNLRPIFTFTAVGSTISITAANCVLKNIVCLSNYTNGVTIGITVAATALALQLLDVEMRETANTKEWLIGVSIGAACHGVVIDGFKYFGIAGGSTSQVIKFAGASNYAIVTNFLIYCDASGAAIDALTVASLFMTFGNGVLHNLDTGAGLSISVKSDTTGFFHDLRISQLKAGVFPAGAAMAISEVFISNVIFTQGFYGIVQDS